MQWNCCFDFFFKNILVMCRENMKDVEDKDLLKKECHQTDQGSVGP